MQVFEIITHFLTTYHITLTDNAVQRHQQDKMLDQIFHSKAFWLQVWHSGIYSKPTDLVYEALIVIS